MAAIRLAADFITFGTLPVGNVYELPPWLLDEFRSVVIAYNQYRAQEMARETK